MTVDLRAVLSDTVHFCRDIVGLTHDEKGGRRGREGGILHTGPHRQMADLLDDRSIRYKLILGPRGCYKSSLVLGFVGRRIVAQPNVRVFYLSSTEAVATDKGRSVRALLESDIVERTFGNQVGEPWEEHRFTVGTRDRVQLQNATFTAMAMEHVRAGNRADIVVVDDPIDEQNSSTMSALEKVRRKWDVLQPMFADGAEVVVLATRWADEDLPNDLMNSPLFQPPYGKVLTFDSGVEIVRRPSGLLDLEPVGLGPPFAHQPIEFLREKFYGMVRKGNTAHFERQYMNRIGGGSAGMFRREHFRTIHYRRTDFANMTGYLLVDVATSLRDEACHSALAYVAVDASDNIYLLDIRLGHMRPTDLQNEYCAMLIRWQNSLNHGGEIWENVGISQAMVDFVRREAGRIGIETNIIMASRSGANNKRARIRTMHGHMETNRFRVADSVPRYYTDNGEELELFNPRGHLDSIEKRELPSGELVNQFLYLNNDNQKVDLADAIAMAVEIDRKTGRRYCRHLPLADYTNGQTVDGLTQPHGDRYTQSPFLNTTHHATESWWDQID